MPGHWLCDQCLKFHLKPKFHPHHGLTKSVAGVEVCVQPYYWHSRLVSKPYTFPPIRASHLMIRMALNCHLFGSEHGERLDIFSKSFHKGSIQDGWGYVSTEARIVANELYMRCKHRIEILSSKDFGYIERYAICPHICSLDPENLMAPIIKCLLSHRNTASCEKCIGLRQCRSCTTEFEIQISRFKATGHVLETTYWKKFGARRSADDPKWAQHLKYTDISDLHAAKFSPGKHSVCV